MRINVRSLKGDLICYKGISNYDVIDGFVTFTDPKTGYIKRFASANVEIEEEREQ
jgi:hypothetical protein